MGDWPKSIGMGDDLDVISTSGLSLAFPTQLAPGTGLAWTSNRAIYVPVRVTERRRVYKLACGTGTGTTGNFDIGLYDWLGNKLVSTGSTARTTASSERIIDVTDTDVYPGRYYLALAHDNGASNTYATVHGASGTLHSLLLAMMGCKIQETAFPLPTTATFAAFTGSLCPKVSAYLRST